ncbi:MAG TPA: methyltransferase domain-containing protein [Pyrinomonadaceae bacterium]|nr:methyltransferase domain-containing protein [Pyrinomonadaceae bacterium]
MKPSNLYNFAGIDDVAEFYRLRYASAELLDGDYFDAVNRFNIRWSRSLWVYDNVKPGATVLDLGCGAGLLSLLKRKGCKVIGVDISADCAAVAMRNGYTLACAGELTALPFQKHSFDYVVSLDVMGHIEFDQKDAVLSEIKRVLKTDGVTLHGIECMNREQQKDYVEMSAEELRQFVAVDGHVGMEDEQANQTRFKRFFANVLTEPRYSVCVPCEELVKQADEYGLPRCDQDFLDYLRGLSFNERRAFNMAMGYVYQRISDYQIKMPASGFLLLKASDERLENIYGEAGERAALLHQTIKANGQVSLNRSDRAAFNSGWYAAENFPPIGRWMSRVGQIRFRTDSLSRIELQLTCHLPGLDKRPLKLEFSLNGEHLRTLSLKENGWMKLQLDVPPELPRRADGFIDCLFEIKADRTWQPCSTNPESGDDRELSIAVCSLEIVG